MFILIKTSQSRTKHIDRSLRRESKLVMLRCNLDTSCQIPILPIT